MQKFMAMYMAPVASMEEWMKQPEEVRKEQQQKMEGEWGVWMNAHKDMLSGGTFALGKNKRVTSGGVADIKNDLMMYSIVEAESQEVAAEIFKNHPHLAIPGGSIEVMPINSIPGM